MEGPNCPSQLIPQPLIHRMPTLYTPGHCRKKRMSHCSPLSISLVHEQREANTRWGSVTVYPMHLDGRMAITVDARWDIRRPALLSGPSSGFCPMAPSEWPRQKIPCGSSCRRPPAMDQEQELSLSLEAVHTCND